MKTLWWMFKHILIGSATVAVVAGIAFLMHRYETFSNVVTGLIIAAILGAFFMTKFAEHYRELEEEEKDRG